MNLNRMAIVGGLSGAVFLSLVAATCGETTTQIDNMEGQQTGITVSGEGKTAGAPDIASISIGVSALADTVADARNQAATSLDAIIASMRANGIEEKDIQTQQLSISPEYDYTDGRQLLRGFRVTNVVGAKLRDIDVTGKVVDDAVNAGGDNTTINGIVFDIEDPEELRTQAREAAVADARRRAETLAQAGGVSLGRPITISETGHQPPIPYAVADSAGAELRQTAPETQIQPGELDVVITVTVTWAIE